MLHKVSRYAWLVVAMLWLVGLLNYLDRLAFTTMRGPIKLDVPMTDAKFGLLMSIFLWVYAAFSPLCGFLADRVGRQRVIVTSLAFWSAATWFSGHAQTFNELFWSRGLMGISEACYIPAALALIADYHRGPTRSLATGLHNSGSYVGIVLGGAGGYVAEYYGWRFGFTVLGAIGVGYALVLIFFLRDAPAERPAAIETSTAKPAAGMWSALFSQPGFYVLLAVDLIVGMVNWPIYTWLPTFLQEHFSLEPGPAGILATGDIQVASFAGALAGGIWADRWSRRRRQGRVWVPAIGYLAAAPCMFLAATSHALPAAIFGLAVFGLGRGFFDANLMPILREVVDPRYSATGYGFLNAISSAAGGLTAYAGGAMKDRGIDLSYIFQGCAAALALTAILLLLVRVRK